LLGAYAIGKGQVDRGIVDKAAEEVFGKDHGAAPRARPADPWKLGSWIALAGALVAGVALVYTLERGRAPVATRAAASGVSPAVAASIAAVAASRSAAGIQPAQTPAFLTAADLQSRFKTLPHDERDAWRALAPAWKLTLTDADAEPCIAAQRSELQCFRSASTTLALIRELDRPGILTLRDADDKPVYALLTGLGDQSATLLLGDVSQSVSLVSLATLWRGEFATLWRAPPGYTGKLVDPNSGPIADWLATQLAKVQGQPVATTDVAWKSQVSSFQLSQGLKADGLAGPTTFMQLNRATGVDEPRLRGAIAAAAH
jgi:general secretion pathway protein A